MNVVEKLFAKETAMIMKGGIVNIAFNGDGGFGEDDTPEGMGEEEDSTVVDDLVFVDTDSSGDGALKLKRKGDDGIALKDIVFKKVDSQSPPISIQYDPPPFPEIRKTEKNGEGEFNRIDQKPVVKEEENQSFPIDAETETKDSRKKRRKLKQERKIEMKPNDEETKGSKKKRRKFKRKIKSTQNAEIKNEIEKSRPKFANMYKKCDQKFICNTCESSYLSFHGLSYHLNTATCGFGTKEKKLTRMNFRGLYTRDSEKFVCRGCGKLYDTIRGVHYHLKTTDCGQLEPVEENDEETKEENKLPKERRDFSQLYTKEDDCYVCARCQARYHSIHGVHSHLLTKVCGFGTDDTFHQKRMLKNFYTRDEGKLVCSSCFYQCTYLGAMSRHFNNSPQCYPTSAVADSEKPEEPEVFPDSDELLIEPDVVLNDTSEIISEDKTIEGITMHLVSDKIGLELELD